MENDDEHMDSENSDNTDIASACFLMVITAVVIAISFVMVIEFMNSVGMVLLSDIRNWAGDDHIVMCEEHQWSSVLGRGNLACQGSTIG